MPAVMQRAQIGRRRRARPLSEINVTPFVDVMLVLLIVFMVTAPLLTVGVPVDLPKTKAQPLSQDREPLTLSVRRDGSIYLQNTRISEDDLVPRLNAIAANGYDQRVFVRGAPAGYRPTPSSALPLAALGARSVGARVFGERDVAAAANAARRFFGNGPTRSIGERRESVPLAPWLTLVALVPLGLVLGRRGGGSSPRRRPLLLRSARA